MLRGFRSKGGSLQDKLKQALGPRQKDSPPTYLDFDFVRGTSSDVDPVKKTVPAAASEHDADDGKEEDPARTAQQRLRQQVEIDSAAVNIGPAAVHS